MISELRFTGVHCSPFTSFGQKHVLDFAFYTLYLPTVVDCFLILFKFKLDPPVGLIRNGVFNF
jgi:hypothetical protein